MVKQIAHEDAQCVAVGNDGQRHRNRLAGNHVARRGQLVRFKGQPQQVGGRLDIAGQQPQRVVQVGQRACVAQGVACARAHRQRQREQRGAGKAVVDVAVVFGLHQEVVAAGF
ncbi:hypothetical protein D3C72_1853890 [compost metagenome]